MMEKLCPLKFITPQNRVADEIGWTCDKNCEWWITRMGGLDIDNCSIKAIAISLLHLSDSLKIKK